MNIERVGQSADSKWQTHRRCDSRSHKRSRKRIRNLYRKYAECGWIRQEAKVYRLGFWLYTKFNYPSTGTKPISHRHY